MKKELYISVDIEANGTHPPRYSMISLGAVAIERAPKHSADYFEIVGTFEVNIEPLTSNTYGPTMEWWKKHPKAWEYTQKDQKTPREAMNAFHLWLLGLQSVNPGARFTFVGYPACYDFMWVNWYMNEFLGSSKPFNFAGLDIKTLNMLVLDCDYSRVSRSKSEKKIGFKSEVVHTHKALDDARGQADHFAHVLEHLKWDKE